MEYSKLVVFREMQVLLSECWLYMLLFWIRQGSKSML